MGSILAPSETQHTCFICEESGKQSGLQGPFRISRQMAAHPRWIVLTAMYPILAQARFWRCFDCVVEVNVCGPCGQTKERYEFKFDIKGPTGLQGTCKECASYAGRHPYERNTTPSNIHKYGLTKQSYHAMMDAQHQRCAICGDGATPARNFSVDHDHESGKVRALLCNRCNTGLGQFRDSPDLLRKAIVYLDAHRTA